jgi:glucokinase
MRDEFLDKQCVSHKTIREYGMAAPRYTIGIDLGGQSVKLAVVDETARIFERDQYPIDATASAEAIRVQIVDAVGVLQRMASADGRHIAAAGMALPGYMDRERTWLAWAANLPTLGGTDFLAALRRSLDVPVVYDSDANAAALGEYRFGAGRGVSRLIVTTVGTGVGAGVVIDGQILRIWNHIAGSLGHVIVDPQGPRCPCGARGCLEAHASGRALERQAATLADARPNGRLAALRRADGRLTGIEIARARREGDHDARRVIEEGGWWLGVGMATWSVIYRPDRILVGGGVAALGAPWLDAIGRGLSDVGQPDATEHITIAPASLAPDSGIVGAAAMAMDCL